MMLFKDVQLGYILFFHFQHNKIGSVGQRLVVKVFGRGLIGVDAVEAVVPTLPHVGVKSLLHSLAKECIYEITECNDALTFV